MLKKLMITLVFLFTVSTFGYAQEKFTVSGEVIFRSLFGFLFLGFESFV